MAVGGAWRRAAGGAGLLGADGSVRPTIFAEMSALAVRTGAINLGQGFPDEDGPAEVTEAAIAAIRAGENQYPPGPGIPALRAAVADHQRRFYGLELDPDREVLVTAGATEAIAAALLGLLEPGDEVVALEPYYDSYAACIAMAGGKRVPVTLRPHEDTFRLDLDELRDAVTDFRESGKLTVAWTESFGEFVRGNLPYYLATAFDRIYLQPTGTLGLTGVAVEQIFLRDALAKAGVDFQSGKRHEYKSAADQFTETGFTGPAREAASRLAESVTEQLTAAIAASRGKPLPQARELVVGGPYGAAGGAGGPWTGGVAGGGTGTPGRWPTSVLGSNGRPERCPAVVASAVASWT